ncbi:ribosomal protein S8 [Xylaria sp. FL1777]|nr:ribosomal protein S8 [Xylaria sp. FL1777]
MGIHSVVHMAAHLQNASRARLGITSVPHTKYNVGVALALHRAGFLWFVTRGGKNPPDPATVGTYEPPPLTSANVAQQRLWVGLKYTQDQQPVLRTVSSLSTSKRKRTADLRSLQRLARGFASRDHHSLNIGETLILATDQGTLELREAVEKRVGGLLLCRAGS